MELQWLKAQREKTGSKSIYGMHGLDGKQMTAMQKTNTRKLKDLQVKRRSSVYFNDGNESSFDDNDNHDTNSPDIEPSTSTSAYEPIESSSSSLKDAGVQTEATFINRSSSTKSARGFLNISPAVECAIRFGVSPSATASIVNGTIAALIDAKYLDPSLQSLCVDAAKVDRAKIKIMGAADSMTLPEIKCLFIDGRNDDTLIMKRNTVTGRNHRGLIKEYHMTVTAEPAGQYITHFTPPPKTRRLKPARQAAIAFHSWMQTKGIDEHLECIGCDTTNEMSGHIGGVVTHTEALLGRRVFRSFCWLHINELPLRHLMVALDGETNSKDGWKGDIGKYTALFTCIYGYTNLNVFLSFYLIYYNFRQRTQVGGRSGETFQFPGHTTTRAPG